MQIFHPQPLHYTPLLSLFFLNLSGASLAHLSLLAFQLLLRPTPTQNYCNAAISIVITPLLLLLNLYDASRIVYSNTQSDFWSMQGQVAFDFRIWIFMMEGVFLVLYCRYCWSKYQEYRCEIFT